MSSGRLIETPAHGPGEAGDVVALAVLRARHPGHLPALAAVHQAGGGADLVRASVPLAGWRRS